MSIFLRKLSVFNSRLSIDEQGTSTCEYDHEYQWVNCPFSILIFPLWILLNGLFIFNIHFSVGSIFYGVCKCILQKYIFMYFCKMYLHFFFFFKAYFLKHRLIHLRNLAACLISWWGNMHWHRQHTNFWILGSL